jgi:hypothetical protein
VTKLIDIFRKVGIQYRFVNVDIGSSQTTLEITAMGLLDHPKAGEGILTSGVRGSRTGYAVGPYVDFHLTGKTSDARRYPWVDSVSNSRTDPMAHIPSRTRSMPHTSPSLHLPEGC